MIKKSILIVVFFSLVLIISGCGQQQNINIEIDIGDIGCVPFWSEYREENPCPSCDYSDDSWICIDGEKASEEYAQLTEEGILPNTCAPCPSTNRDQFECQVIDNQCEKVSLV